MQPLRLSGVRALLPGAGSRRGLVVTTAALALAVAGCGGSGAGAAGDAGTAPSDGGTRTVLDALGTAVQVPREPRRVVFVGYETLVTAVSLGHVPAGITWHDDAEPIAYLEETFDPPGDLGEVAVLGDSFEVNIEAVAQLDPDLVVAEAWMEPDVHDKISRIAPTVRFDFRDTDDPVGAQREMAEVLGLTEEFDAEVARLDERIERLRSEHADVWGELEFVMLDQYSPADDNYYYPLDSPYNGLVVLRELGARQAATVEDLVAGQEYVGVSAENVSQYDADLIVLTTPELGPLDPAVERVLPSTFAGRRNQVLHVDTGIWSASNLPGLHMVVDDLEELLAGDGLDVSGDFG